MKTQDELNNTELDAKTLEVLADFKSSVQAWSDEAMRQARPVPQPHRVWRPALAWALTAVITAGTVSGVAFEHNRRVQQARIAAEQEAAHQRQLAAQKALEEEKLLANVDSDVSRAVPSAMQPLADLMSEDTAE